MQITKSKPTFNIVVILLIVGLYIIYLLHYFDVLSFKTHEKPVITMKKYKQPILKGPYEYCEDFVCKDCTTVECKKKCMCDKRSEIKNCCISSCPENNMECIDSCFPIFDTC